MSSLFERSVLALTVGETQPLFSSELTSESELLFRRSVRERVGAPRRFLDLDGDRIRSSRTGGSPGCSTPTRRRASTRLSQFVTVSGVPAASDLTGRNINYLHAAVKATVDAETGETHFYRVD